jgi:hypothetical protein
VVGWTGNIEGELTRESVASHLLSLAHGEGVHRVIVAMPDRRGTLPVEELLDLRLEGVKVEEATSWLEKISDRIEVEQLYPSWLIFAEGFRFNSGFLLIRRLFSTLVALCGLFLALPLLPFVWLAVRLDFVRSGALPAEARRARGGNTFTVISSARCVRTRKPTPAPLGLPTMIRGSRAWGSSCAPRVLMRSRSCGVC